jgi:hypothetical protein
VLIRPHLSRVLLACNHARPHAHHARSRAPTHHVRYNDVQSVRGVGSVGTLTTVPTQIPVFPYGGMVWLYVWFVGIDNGW